MANSHPVIRSISLPSREHPCSVRIEALLKTLKSFLFSSPEQQSQIFPDELNTVQTSLVALAELYVCVEEFINSPIQTTKRQQKASPELERALEDSIALIDTCNAARDTLTTTNQHVREIQSALRRRGRSAEAKVNAFLRFRKKSRKGSIAKCLGELKKLESHVRGGEKQSANSEICIDRVLRETSSITASVFRRLLRLISSQSSSTSATSGWSLVSDFVMMRKRVSFLERENDSDNVDVSLQSLLGSMESDEAVKVAQKTLETLASSSETLMSELDSMFRCLVKNRVSLLNALTQS